MTVAFLLIGSCKSDVSQSTSTGSAVVPSARSRLFGLLKKTFWFSVLHDDPHHQMVGFCKEMKAAGVMGNGDCKGTSVIT